MSVKKTLRNCGIIVLIGFAFYLFRPLSNVPQPADFNCIQIEDGTFIPMDSLPKAQNIYGMGLTYSHHIIETASDFDPKVIPPIFKKSLHSVVQGGSDVKMPSKAEMIAAVDAFESGLGEKLEADFDNLTPLLDYEVELGFVLLETINPVDLDKSDFVPPIGFFISNDLSARSIALLGEGTNKKYEFWGISKSFPGFMPISNQVWIPNQATNNSIPCINIETLVNGSTRQSQSTSNMIYTPLEMLRFINQKYPNTPLEKGDMILTGTPGGVAIATPKVLVRISNLLGFDRFRKLSIKLGGDQTAFLKEGDVVEVRGKGLGSSTVTIK